MRAITVVLLLSACDKPDPERPRDRDTETRAEDTDTGPKQPSGPPARLSGAYSLAEADARIDAAPDVMSFGTQMTGVGDVDGDGRNDAMLAAHTDTNPTFEGELHGQTWLVPGGIGAGEAQVDEVATGSLQGTRASELAGRTATPLGDWNGDGFADLAIGAPGTTGTSGRVAVVYGPFAGDIRFDAADAVLNGPSDAWAGSDVFGGVDFSGDGRGDLVVASSRGLGEVTPDVWLVSEPVTGIVALDDVATAHLSFPAAGSSTVSVTNAGDTDGDGLPSLAVLVRGTWQLSRFDAPLVGELTPDAAAWTLPVPEDDFGYAVLASGGDADGDGYTEVPVSLTSANVVHLVGEPSVPGGGWADATRATLSHLTAVSTGVTVSFVGDLDADGFEDLAVGAVHDDVDTWATEGPRGAVYLLYGPVSGAVDLEHAAATFVGDRATAQASYVGNIGDLDGDGYADLAIGAPGANPSDGSLGSVYLFLGGTQP